MRRAAAGLTVFFTCLVIGMTAQAATIVLETPEALVFGSTVIVPMQPMAELCGATLEATPTIFTVRRGNLALVYDLRAGQVLRNGLVVLQPLTPFLRGETLYVPARPFVEALGGRLQFNKVASQLTVRFSGPAVTLSLPLSVLEGSSLDYVDDDIELFQINRDGTGRRRLTYNRRWDRLPAISPDGARLAYDGGGRVVIRRVDDPRGLSIYPEHPDPGQYSFWDFSFTRDSTRLLWASEQPEGSTLMTANSDGSGLVDLGINGGSPGFSPDGRLIACDTIIYEYTPSVIVLTLDGKGVGHHILATEPFFSGDGKTLYFIRLRKKSLHHVPSRLLQAPVAPDGTIGAPASSPLPYWPKKRQLSLDGTTFFFSGLDGIYRLQTDGTGLTRLTTDEQDDLLCVGPDGAIVFERNRTLYLLDRNSAKPREITRIHIEEPSPAQAIFTPDGRSLVFLDVPVWSDQDDTTGT